MYGLETENYCNSEPEGLCTRTAPFRRALVSKAPWHYFGSSNNSIGLGTAGLSGVPNTASLIHDWLRLSLQGEIYSNRAAYSSVRYGLREEVDVQLNRFPSVLGAPPSWRILTNALREAFFEPVLSTSPSHLFPKPGMTRDFTLTLICEFLHILINPRRLHRLDSIEQNRSSRAPSTTTSS